MGFLTTHALDTAHRHPAAGVRIERFRISDDRYFLCNTTTNKDGRCDGLLLQENEFQAGEYELIFHTCRGS